MSAEAAHRHTAACYRRSARALCLIVALRGATGQDALVTEALYQCAVAVQLDGGVWS